MIMKSGFNCCFFLILLFSSSFARGQHNTHLDFTCLSQIQAESVVEIQTALRIDPRNNLKMQYDHIDDLGIQHNRLQQFVDGYPVEGAVIAIHKYPSGSKSVNGHWIKNMHKSAPDKVISESQVFSSIRSDFPTDRKLSWEIEDLDVTYRTEIEKVWFDNAYSSDRANYKFVFKVNFYISNPLEAHIYYIDAVSGNILSSYSSMHCHNVPASAEGLYTSGPVTFTVDSVSTDEYKMIKLDEAGKSIIQTHDVLNGSKVISSTDNEWSDKAAVDCHWGSEKTLEYFEKMHSREGMDGQGGNLVVNVHAQDPMGGGAMGNAYYLNSTIYIGDGNGSQDTNVPLSSLDIIAHEIVHGVTEFTANLKYQGESGAINESMSDVFGVTIEESTKGTSSWDIGHQLNAILRRMNDPKSLEMPAFYKGEYWINGADVHINSSIGNLWYYYLVEGGAGTSEDGVVFNIEGIGFERAIKIVYRTLSEYLTELSDYSAYRELSIQAAEDLFGPCSREVVNASLAWSAVGLGEVIVGNDLELISIDNIASDCGLVEEEVSIDIKYNSCGDSLPLGSELLFFYSINGDDPVSESYELPKALAPNDQLSYTFLEKADISNFGDYNIQSWVDFDQDAYSVNDSIATQFKNGVVQNEDIRLVNLIHPKQNTACGLAIIDPIIKLQFLGCEKLEIGSELKVRVDLENALLEEIFVLEEDIDSESFFELTLSGTLEVQDFGIYLLNVDVTYPQDPDLTNNTFEQTIEFSESKTHPFMYPFDDPSDVFSLNVRLGSSVDKDTLVNRFDDSNESQALMFTGGDVMDLSENELKIDLVTSEEEIWTKNLDYETRTCMCIDATEWNEIYLSYDLHIHQVLGLWNSFDLRDPWAANMRVLVNGEPVTETYGHNDNSQFENYMIDLSDYAGSSPEICFQSKSLIGRNLYDLILNGKDLLGDQVILDNINVSNRLTTSIIQQNIQLHEMKVYPNPAHDLLNIELNSQETQNITFQIINTLGVKVRQFKEQVEIGTNNLSISLKDLSHGVYILKANSRSQQYSITNKIVIGE